MSEAKRTAIPEALFEADDLPTIPAVAVEVLRLCRDEDTTLDDLAEVLANDAALAARLLKFSNSSLYNLGQEVSSLQRAALVLGMKTVQLMSLSFSLASSLPRENAENAFDYAEFWRRSIIRAVAGRTLANLVQPALADEAFLCGLLAEIGQIVLAQCLTEEYETVLGAAGERWPTAALEAEELGFDHVDVGVTLLESWQFPELVRQALAALNRGAEARAECGATARTISQILEVAAHTANLFTEERGAEALTRIEEQCGSDFDLPGESVDLFLSSLEERVRETSEMLNVSVSMAKTHEEIVAEARAEFVRHSLGTARELETTKRATDLAHRRRILDDPDLNDPETGIPNREAFELFLTCELQARLDGVLHRPLGILMIEIDRFSGLDAVPGPNAREEALRMVGATLARLIRKSDLTARAGGDAFAVIMGEASPFALKSLAERLRRDVEAQSFDIAGAKIAVTITIGGACLGGFNSLSDGQGLLEVARRFLKRARSNGPNRTLIRARPIFPRAGGAGDVRVG